MEDDGELLETRGSDPSDEGSEAQAGPDLVEEARALDPMAQNEITSPQIVPAAPPSSGAEVVVYSEPGVVTVTIPDRSARTKTEKTDSTTDGEVQPRDVGNNSASHCKLNWPPCQFNIHKTATRTITPPGGSSGQLKSEGTAFVDVYTIPTCCFTKADYYNTTSYSQWTGGNPWNATSIKHTDVWDIDYLAVSVSFGGTPSGTINLGSGRLSYENTEEDTWRVQHNVQHMYLKVSGGRITKVKYEVHGSYGFGSTFYTTDAYSSVALPP